MWSNQLNLTTAWIFSSAVFPIKCFVEKNLSRCQNAYNCMEDSNRKREGMFMCLCLCVLHVFLLVIVLPQGISFLTATSFVFICAAQLNTRTKFGSHPTPCLLLVNNFYKSLEKRKKIWHETKGVQTKKQSDDRRDEDRMKWMVIGWEVRQGCWNESELPGSTAVFTFKEVRV